MTHRLITLIAAATSLLMIGAAGASLAASQDDVSSSCVAPAKGPLLAMAQESTSSQVLAPTKPSQPMAKVGKSAPDFEANAFVSGSFKNIKLSDFKGKWVVLCFYPGDFTFV